tara:strand:+ start:135 stop:488 length:354 start_codon:yes stop_codon:yes gene_type:complete
MMALPLLAAAKVASILGPGAFKAAKLAYKLYKKRGGKKSEKKFLSDKAHSKNRQKNRDDRESQKSELDFERSREYDATGGGLAQPKMNRRQMKAEIKSFGFTGKNRPKTLKNFTSKK